MPDDTRTSVSQYWARDLSRHGLLADGLGQRLWKCRPPRGWASVVTAVMILVGIEFSMILVANPAEWFGVPSAMWAVFAWVPWLSFMLGIMHAMRFVAISRAEHEDDEVFTAICIGAGATTRTARAVRRALAKVYGVPVQAISALDTGWSLSRFMEAPAAAEVAHVLAEELPWLPEPEQLLERLKQMRRRSTVADLARITICGDIVSER